MSRDCATVLQPGQQMKKYLDDYSGRVSALAIKDMGSLSSMNMDAKRP